MEIERKYLVNALPEDLNSYPHLEIEQGYLCTSPTLRIRKAGDVYWLTIKEKLTVESTAIHNREEEFRLTVNQYNHLKNKCDGRIILKTRYTIPLACTAVPLVAELDVFHGVHEGLCVVEVEFPDTELANHFIPPSWFGEDVSRLPQFRNSYLAFN